MSMAAVVPLFLLLSCVSTSIAATVKFPTTADLGVLKQLNKTLKLSSWNPSNPCDNWKYVACDGGRVYSLSIGDGLLLNAPLPSNFGDLSALQNFAAPYAGIKGPLPESFQNLVQLVNLVLNNNNLTGTIPAGFSKLKKLTYVDFRYNNFNGVLPYSLSLPNLAYLDLSFNNFYGAYPPNFVASIFTIDNNQFSGPIPTKFPSDTSTVSTKNNYFTGTANLTFGGKSFCYSIIYLNNNCLSYKPKPACSNYIVNQRSSSVCKSFCGANSSKGACNGNGVCRLTGAKNVPTCVCNPGYKSGSSGNIPTCLKA